MRCRFAPPRTEAGIAATAIAVITAPACKGVKPLTAFFISTLMQHVLSRPDFLAYEAISEHGLNLPMRLVRLMRPWMVAWTIRSQDALDHTRGKYDIAIFEGFVPPAKRG